MGNRDSDEELTGITKENRFARPIDDLDKKKFKEGKLSFIGIKPRVDTNRKQTKA